MEATPARKLLENTLETKVMDPTLEGSVREKWKIRPCIDPTVGLKARYWNSKYLPKSVASKCEDFFPPWRL